jgi:hypothetical protein
LNIPNFLKLGLIVQNAMMVFLLLTFTLSENKWFYLIWVVFMFGTMAGTTTYLTATTATTFGLKYFSTNYGLVSSSMVCIYPCSLMVDLIWLGARVGAWVGAGFEAAIDAYIRRILSV